jgi:hypothetical protein
VIARVALVALAVLGAPAGAQPAAPPSAPSDGAVTLAARPSLDALPRYRNPADRAASDRARAAAARDAGLRVVVSVEDRRLWVLAGRDTLREAPVAVGMERLLEYGGRRWAFATPRGVRVVRDKRAEPLWRPPDWAYAEAAREYGFRLAHLSATRPVRLRDGRLLVVRDSLVGLMLPDGFAPLPTDEHIVFDSTLYVPPLGTHNRQVPGELGPFQLDLGNGYLLHGAPRAGDIGSASTHGCVRLRDDDLAWLYERVPVGTRVYIY